MAVDGAEGGRVALVRSIHLLCVTFGCVTDLALLLIEVSRRHHGGGGGDGGRLVARQAPA